MDLVPVLSGCGLLLIRPLIDMERSAHCLLIPAVEAGPCRYWQVLFCCT
jgi:hypothetical protein